MEKKQDDARNTETEKKPEAAGQHAQPGSARPDQVTDVELTNEQATPEKTTANTDKADPAAAGKAVSGAAGGSVPPVNTGKDERNAGKGTKGPLIAAVVVVAAIAAGGYYYAQNNQSESESSSQTVSEPAGSSTSDTSSTSATSASDAAKPDEAAAPDTTSSTSDTADNAASAPNGDAASTPASGGETERAAAGADESTSATAGAPATDEAETSNSSASADSAAANSDSAQTESDTKADAATQSGASVTDGNASAGESTDTTATTEKTDTTSASESAAATTESSSAPAETASAVAADTGNTSGNAATGTAGFGGSIPADIRDQLDRQSAQIIALRDQLESSQKQLQQLQTTRLQAARDETTMFVVNDVSRLVTMAQNELAIAGNLENAVMSLETGIKAIDQADAPVLAGLRGALAADIVTLKSAPAIGVDAQFAEVAALSGKIDTLPMLAPDQAGAKPMAGQSTQVGAAANEANETNSTGSSDAWYERAWNEVKTWPGAAWNGLRSDLGGIVRVEKLADPNQVLLSVDQAAQLRANLQQYLHFAQQALLNGQQGIWTSSLETVVKGIKQSFNQDSVETQHVLTQLQQLLKAGVKPELPPITQSVKAVEETRKQLKSMNPGQE